MHTVTQLSTIKDNPVSFRHAFTAMATTPVRCLSLICLLLIFTTTTSAEVTRIVATASGPIGSYGDRHYIWVDAHMHGKLTRADGSTGVYRVPVTLTYSDQPSNKPALIDLINSASYKIYQKGKAPFGRRNLYRVSEYTIGDHLWVEGHHSINLQWAKLVTWIRGPEYGIIEDARDGYRIWEDAAEYHRSPINIEGDLPFQPSAVKHVIAFGYSQPASLLHTFVKRGMNRRNDGSLVFDGILAGASVTGGNCIDLVDDDTIPPLPQPQNPTFASSAPCKEKLQPDGKFFTIATQTDVALLNGHIDRDTSADFYRQYELAGISHIPSNQLPLKLAGAYRQNPADQKPFYKAALNNLSDWIMHGTIPPPSAYLEGTVNADGKFEYTLDSEGNVLGGIRLPHMTSTLDNGELAGAPLGTYTGIELEISPADNLFAFLGGTFTPFTKDQLKQKYKTDKIIADRIRKSADALLKQRYILPSDHAAYHKKAPRWTSEYVGIF